MNIAQKFILPPSHKKRCMFFVYHLTYRPDCPNRPQCHFSTIPRSVLENCVEKTNFLLEMWPHGADEFKKSEWKLPQNIAKWADLAKPKIFKNPPKIQFWSDCKMPIVKNYQNIKSFQIFKIKLVWPQLSNSPDLSGLQF